MQSPPTYETEHELDDLLPEDWDTPAYTPEETPTDLDRVVRCKTCSATTYVSAASFSNPEAQLIEKGWTCTLVGDILTKTLCPDCAKPPPYVPKHVVESLLESIETTVEKRTSRRVSNLKEARTRLVATMKAFDPQRTAAAYIRDLESCSEQWSLFSVDGELTAHPIRCRKRACPICESMRMKRWYHKMSAFVKVFSAPKHITFTLKSSTDPLDEQLTRLIHAFRQIRQRALWKKRCPWGVWTIEITYNNDTGLWHPHIHVICNSSFIPIGQLRAQWHKITGDSFEVDVRAVKSNIAGYICRYIAKTSTIYQAPVDPFKVNAALKGKRLIQPFGRWPKLPKPEKSRVRFIGTIPDIVFQARAGDPRARAYCAIIRQRWPGALLNGVILPRPPNLPARHPTRIPVRPVE